MMSLFFPPDMEPGEALVNFNQNSTSLVVSSKSGYNIYSLETVDFLKRICRYSTKEVFLIERLFETSLVVIVANNPRKLQAFNIKTNVEICSYIFPDTILSVKLNRDRLAVCCENNICIHDIHNMKIMHTIVDTPCNSIGLCALSPSSEHCYLAYPGSVTTGEVLLFDALNLHAKFMIPAHDSPLAALAFNSTGTEIATASERGTVIRIFSTLTGAKLIELRRGYKRCVSIACLAFSTCDQYLVASSNTETVHIFRLQRPPSENSDTKESSDDWMGYSFLNFLGQTVSSYLPTQVTDVFTQSRPLASVILPKAGIKRVCALTEIKKQLRLLIASEDGYFYVYTVPSEEGGECQLIKRHDLLHEEYYVVNARVELAASSASAMETRNPSPDSAGAASFSSKEEVFLDTINNCATYIKTEEASNDCA